MLERLWRMKEAILVFSLAGMAVLLAPAPLWVRAVGFAAATVVYWRYVWKYKGVKEETARGPASESANGSGARTTTSSGARRSSAGPCSVRRMPDLPALDVAIGLVFLYVRARARLLDDQREHLDGRSVCVRDLLQLGHPQSR